MLQILYRARYLIVLIVLMGVLACLDQSWVDFTYFKHEAIQDGQWWRLWTGHLAHATRYHWFINTLCLVALYYFFSEYFDKRYWLLTILLIMPAVSLGLYFWDTDLEVYTGFSGIAQAWLSFLLVRSFHETPKFNAVLLVMQWGRIVYEHSPNYDVNYMQELIHAAVAVDAHLFGAAMGVVCGLLCFYWDKKERLQMQ